VRRPSPALAIACLALFVALGGTGYAVSELPKNSVGTKQLKLNAVTGPKVRNGALGRADLKAGTIPPGYTFQRIVGAERVRDTTFDTAELTCPHGVAIGGGALTSNDQTSISSSGPGKAMSQWVVTVRKDGIAAGWKWRPAIVCANRATP
jgi:hypothetical protein